MADTPSPMQIRDMLMLRRQITAAREMSERRRKCSRNGYTGPLTRRELSVKATGR